MRNGLGLSSWRKAKERQKEIRRRWEAGRQSKREF